jgi:hypothetical protein
LRLRKSRGETADRRGGAGAAAAAAAAGGVGVVGVRVHRYSMWQLMHTAQRSTENCGVACCHQLVSSFLFFKQKKYQSCTQDVGRLVFQTFPPY